MKRSTSVLIPVHNQVRYLFRAVASAYWQLGPDDRIIVVDDASTDMQGCGGIERFMDRVTWIRNPTKRGVSHSRNQGILQATTEWIKFLDADDVLAPYALNKILFDDEIPDQIKVLTGGCHRVIDHAYRDFLTHAGENLEFIMYVNPILPSATFVRRQTLLDVGLFDERIDFEEDWDLWLRIHEKHGRPAFLAVEQPFCFYWIEKHDRELSDRTRHAQVDGLPVREYFKKRYGVDPK